MNSKGLEIEIVELKAATPRNSTRHEPEPLELATFQKESDNTSQSNEKAIQFSSKIIKALKSKVKEHNKEYSKKVNLDQLKKIFRKGSSAYAASHKSGVSRTIWSLARVSTFLRMMSGKSVEGSYLKINENTIRASEIDISDNWEPSEEDLNRSERDVVDFDLDYDFEDENDLYLDTQDEERFSTYI